MPFEKGKSANPKGRPKRSEEEKQLKQSFIDELKKHSMTALENLVNIANDSSNLNKDRLKANTWILEHTFGENFIAIEDEKSFENITVNIIRQDGKSKKKSEEEESEEEEW